MFYNHEGVKQERFDESTLTTQNCKVMMQDDINFENTRVNVDSAKKIAVMQHMEYDGFHQMVLGANLKPTKGISAYGIFKPQEYEKTINSVATFQSIAHGDNVEGGVTFNNDVIRMLFELQDAENLQPPENVGVFEKFLCKKLTTPLQRYTYLRLFQMDLYKKIFIGEFDAEVFTMIVNVLNEQVIDNISFNNMVE